MKSVKNNEEVEELVLRKAALFLDYRNLPEFPELRSELEDDD